MLGQFKPIAFEPYGKRRARRLLPRWLVLLLTGIVIGAGSVVLVQERYLPPRLSAEASAELRKSLEQAETERLRLKSELGDTAKRLETALADKNGLVNELTASRETIERLREDVASVVASLPSDPRGGAIEVRAARFTVEGSALTYDVVLSRERADGKPFVGVMQLTVAGESGRGAENSITLKPVAVSVGKYESVRGILPLPEGFKPRRTTINVLDRVDGKRLGMRVMHVK
jgi:hypothetical protein